MAAPDVLTRGRMAAYSAPGITLAALGLPLSMYIPNFYVSNMGVTAVAAGTVFMLLRFWDVITDPMLGFVSDRVHPKMGRRKFWIMLSVPLLMLSVYMVFLPPDGAGPWYLALWLFVLYIGWTMMQISHLAWATELTPDYDQRSRIMGYREIAVLLGMFTVLGIAAMREIAVPSDQVQAVREQSVAGMGLFVVILTPLTVAVALFMVPDKAPRPVNRPNLMQGLKAIGQNIALRRLVISDLLYRAGTGFTGTLFLWFMGERLDLARFASITLTVYFLAALFGVPIWMWLAKHLDKPKAYIISLLSAGLCLMPFLLLNVDDPTFDTGTVTIDVTFLGIHLHQMLNGDQIIGLMITIFYGLTYGGAPFLARAIIAEVIDEDELATGERRSGLFFSLLTLTEKVGYALAVGISIYMIGIIGFDPVPGADNSADTSLALAILYVVPAAILFVLGALFMVKFPITRDRHREVMEALNEQGSFDAYVEPDASPKSS